MKCPYCGGKEDKVIDSRSQNDGYAKRRRRECLSCHRRFTTYEKIEDIPLMVIKKDRSLQQFDREKLMCGLKKACDKRPVSLERLENIIDEIESLIYNREEREIEASDIGELVMEHLKNLDEVAYVRFASVYRQFRDIGTFMTELQKMMEFK